MARVTTATMTVEMITVDHDQYVYTQDEVERLLWLHLARRPELSTHGRTVARYGAGPYICPRCLDDPERRKECVFCDATGRVADVVPGGSSGVPSISDALLTKADLLRAMQELPRKYRVLILHYYALGESTERLGWILARYNGGVQVSARTVRRWRWDAVGMLVAILNRTYARGNA